VALRAAFEANAVSAGDLVVMLAGHPIEGAQRAPTIRVCRVRSDGGPSAPI
jgi:pyruvate kinase